MTSQTALTRFSHRPLVALVAAGVTSILVLGGCSASLPSSSPGAIPQPDPLISQAPEGFEEYYGQIIEWGTCDVADIVPSYMAAPQDPDNYQCATVSAPMNWDDPDSTPIELGVARYVGAADGGERPPLFYNLGGPGGGAIDSLVGFTTSILTDQVADSFYIVALDPRGVGLSTPLWCMTDEERDEDNALTLDFTDMSTEELLAWNETEVARLGNQCLERNGDILGFVDTDSAARDFDMVRAVLGAEVMDYLGFSYGTLLGATYADLFPEHVGRFVLDGALDPAMNVNEVSAAQIGGMEASLNNWIETCVAEGECPLGDSLEAGQQTMMDFFAAVEEEPLETSDPSRPLTLGLAETAVVGSLYSTESYSLLTQGMAQALGSDDGSILLFLADFFNNREADGTYSANSSDAFLSINMLDYEPVGTPEEWEVEARELREKYPILGADAGFASAGLDAWPVESRSGRRVITAQGAPPMLIIGTTHDPATPYIMAENMHRELENSVLLTVEGWNHTAYSSGASACVTGAVDNFLLTGELPKDGTVCE